MGSHRFDRRSTPATAEGGRFRGPRSRFAVVLAVFTALPSFALALDQPMSAKQLTIKSTLGGVEALFVTTDPAVPFPERGSSDDPSAGPSGRLFIEIFSTSLWRVVASAPSGLGNPGWKVGTSGPDFYKYRNRSPDFLEIRNATLVEGKRLRIRTPLEAPYAAPMGNVAVRVTMGSLRSCALFAGASIRRDRGRFVAKDAPAPALADCESATLEAAIGPGCSTAASPACDAICSDGGICTSDAVGGGCRCVYPTQPCGTTVPICGGDCGPGEQCYPMNGFIPGPIDTCACAPVGAPPCGTTGLSCDAGGCPEGLECQFVLAPGFYDSHCSCVAPDATCGPGFGTCPPGFTCLFVPHGSFECLPL